MRHTPLCLLRLRKKKTFTSSVAGQGYSLHVKPQKQMHTLTSPQCRGELRTSAHIKVTDNTIHRHDITKLILLAREKHVQTSPQGGTAYKPGPRWGTPAPGLRRDAMRGLLRRRTPQPNNDDSSTPNFSPYSNASRNSPQDKDPTTRNHSMQLIEVSRRQLDNRATPHSDCLISSSSPALAILQRHKHAKYNNIQPHHYRQHSSMIQWLFHAASMYIIHPVVTQNV